MASHHADQVIKRASRDGTVLEKYKCPYCQSFHVTKRKLGVAADGVGRYEWNRD
jgi:hypothetical protein